MFFGVEFILDEEKRTIHCSPTQADYEAAIFCSIPGGGVECLGWLRLVLTESKVGRPLTSAPWSTAGLGQSGKGAVSCRDSESGLEVMGRREKEPCLWRGTKWITAIFLLLCLTVRVESGGPDNKGTEPQTPAKWRTAQEGGKKSCLMELISCHLWWFGWTYDEVILISVLMSAQTVEQGGGNDWNIFFYFLAPTLLI